MAGDVTCRSNTGDPEHCLHSEGWNPAQKTHNKF